MAVDLGGDGDILVAARGALERNDHRIVAVERILPIAEDERGGNDVEVELAGARVVPDAGDDQLVGARLGDIGNGGDGRSVRILVGQLEVGALHERACGAEVLEDADLRVSSDGKRLVRNGGELVRLLEDAIVEVDLSRRGRLLGSFDDLHRDARLAACGVARLHDERVAKLGAIEQGDGALRIDGRSVGVLRGPGYLGKRCGAQLCRLRIGVRKHAFRVKLYLPAQSDVHDARVGDGRLSRGDRNALGLVEPLRREAAKHREDPFLDRIGSNVHVARGGGRGEKRLERGAFFAPSKVLADGRIAAKEVILAGAARKRVAAVGRLDGRQGARQNARCGRTELSVGGKRRHLVLRLVPLAGIRENRRRDNQIAGNLRRVHHTEHRRFLTVLAKRVSDAVNDGVA